MNSSQIKKVKPLDTSRWQFPDLPKHKDISLYSSKSYREKRAKEIVSDLNRNYFLENANKWASEKTDENSQLPRVQLDKTVSEVLKTPGVLSEKEDGGDMIKTDDSREMIFKIDDVGEDALAESRMKMDDADSRKEKTASGVKTALEVSESESFNEINVIEKKYFKKWHEIVKRNISERMAKFRKNLFESSISQPVDLEEELWQEWKQIENEAKEMKAILFLRWTSPSDIDYTLAYAKYVTEYKRNPLQWNDFKQSVSSSSLEVQSLRRCRKLEETFQKLRGSFVKVSQLQESMNEDAEVLLMEKEKQYMSKIEAIKGRLAI